MSNAPKIQPEPTVKGPEDLRQLMKRLSINNISNFELEEIFNEGMVYMRNCSLKRSREMQVLVVD